MSSKVNVKVIWDAQFATFRGYDKGSEWLDALIFAVGPMVLGVVAALWAPHVYAVSSVLTGVAVFTALLVALLVNIFNFSVKIRRDEQVRPEEKLATTVDELMANAAWSVLAGLALVLLLVAAAATQAPGCALNRFWVGVLTALFLHLIVSVLMVISRIWSAHEEIKQLPPKRK